MQKVFIKTFGCRTNLYDSQIMLQNIKDFEIINDETNADIVIINSCSVTNGADSGVKSYINKMKKLEKKVYLTGCGVKTKGKDLFESSLVFGVFPHSQKENINNLLKQKSTFFIAESSPTHIDSTIIEKFIGKSRAFIKIQEGCDFKCSYCIIPFTRGPARSLSQQSILNQIEILASSGVQEVVLTGTNVGSYGKDTNTNLAKLLNEIYKLNVLKRVRIGSLEPSQIDEELLEILQCEIMERHLHIALQHTSDTMLEIMNRINRTHSDLKLCNKLKNMGFCVGSDFIVGHPGESGSVWQEALQNLKNLPLTHIHPFIYSKRDGTKSAIMKQEIKGDIAKTRLHMLKEIVESKNVEFRNSNKSTPLKVLIESSRQENGMWRCNGFDQFFNKIELSSKSALPLWIEIKNYDIAKKGNYAFI